MLVALKLWSFCFFCLCPYSYGGVLEATPGSKVVEGIKITESAKIKIADRAYALRLVGAGLRYKKVALFKANVYVGELLMDLPEKFQRTATGALGSLSEQKVVAMRMTFLRDVDAEKVSNGFKDGLEENQAQVNSAQIQGFLNAVKAGGEAKEKTTIVVVGEKLPGGKESISYESSTGKLVTVMGEAGFVREVFSIWLGKNDDSGLENLKKEILSQAGA